MDPVAGEFNFTRLEKVTFGPGKAASLGHELEALLPVGTLVIIKH